MAETNKSKMMSEAEIIEAINSDSLVSVSLGSGQPQKNVKLSTLASVVAGVIGTATNSKNGLMPSSQFLVRDTISADVQITSFTQIKDGITFFFGAGTSYFPQSNGVVFKMSGYNSALLICCNQNADRIYIRMIREEEDSGWKAI